MMNRSERKRRTQLPQWQSDKMRSIIEDRWSEVWKTVVNQERDKRLQQHSRASRHSS